MVSSIMNWTVIVFDHWSFQGLKHGVFTSEIVRSHPADDQKFFVILYSNQGTLSFARTVIQSQRHSISIVDTFVNIDWHSTGTTCCCNMTWIRDTGESVRVQSPAGRTWARVRATKVRTTTIIGKAVQTSGISRLCRCKTLKNSRLKVKYLPNLTNECAEKFHFDDYFVFEISDEWNLVKKIFQIFISAVKEKFCEKINGFIFRI